MKKIATLFIFLFATALYPQKDNTLFWEISGNGLQKKSYVYGTMHVNEKVSYHLSDAFYNNLLAADIVSNESNPETWGDLIALFQDNEVGNQYKFYSEFYLFPAKKENIATAFVNTNYFDKMLSGIDGEQADFQENTVLDMFIFQTGKKYNKKIVGLEDAKQSILPILQLKGDDAKPIEENMPVLVKILKNRSFTEALRQYYREKDIVMLDSIYKLMFSKKAHSVLITTRNEKMAASLDSLSRTGSVFSAVGAAHLAGKEGVIALLRKRGFTLTPISDALTDVGRAKKKTIEAYFPNPGFVASKTNDGMLSIPLNKKQTVTDDNIGSPDLTNGGAIAVKRIPLYDYLKKNPEGYNPKALDSLFFENIAGEILEKKYIEAANYRGYDIKNITKTGNNQRHRFYITPLELIAVSMTGTANYVRTYETAVFDKINLKPFSDNWEKIAPSTGGFAVEVPAFHTVYGNNPEQPANITIQAYDNTEKGYYFMTERTLNSTYYLEDTAFEHKQIHHEFYLQHSIDTLQTASAKDHSGFVSESVLGGKKIKLKSVIKGSKYYILGTVNASDAHSERFFNSFANLPLQYKTASKTFTDTVGHFKIDIPEKQNAKLFLYLDSEPSTKNTFLSKNIDYDFRSETGKMVSLAYRKYQKYEAFESIDSVKAHFRKDFLDHAVTDYNEYEEEDYYYSMPTSMLNSDFNTRKGLVASQWENVVGESPNDYLFLSESDSFDKEKNIHTFNAVVSRPNSTQAIKYKVLFRGDSSVTLSTLVEKDYKGEDAFIEKTFGTLDFTDKNTNSVFDDKVAAFIADAKSEKDTIRNSALSSAYNLEIKAKDFKAVTDFLNSYDFKDDGSSALTHLLEQVGTIPDSRVIPFLVGFYNKKDLRAEIQLSVLKALSNQKSKQGYKKIIELMKADLPLSDDAYEVRSLFNNFETDEENSKVLFPDILQFYTTDEYKSPLLDFSQAMLDAGQIQAKSLSSLKKTWVSNANAAYKRASNKPKKSSEETYAEESDTTISELVTYLNILYYFPADKDIDKLFTKVKTLQFPELKAEFLRLSFIHDKTTPTEMDEALKDPALQFIAVNLLANRNDKSFSVKRTDDEIARSAVLNFENLTEKDSVSLLKKIVLEDRGKSFTYFFFRLSRANAETGKSDKQIYPLAFLNENGRINPLVYKRMGTEIDVEDGELEEKYKTIINQSVNYMHTRASFVKQEAITLQNPEMY